MSLTSQPTATKPTRYYHRGSKSNRVDRTAGKMSQLDKPSIVAFRSKHLKKKRRNQDLTNTSPFMNEIRNNGNIFEYKLFCGKILDVDIFPAAIHES